MKTEYTHEEWFAEGKRRFGDDLLKWRFVCPACKHVQSIGDFKHYKDKGATFDSAYFNCIGRYVGAKKNAGLSGNGGAKGPCDYTSGGLFDIRPVTVTMPDGKKVRSFDFDEPLVIKAMR